MKKATKVTVTPPERIKKYTTELIYIFAILSLEGIKPFYEYFGIDVPDKEKFRTLLQETLLETNFNEGNHRLDYDHFEILNILTGKIIDEYNENSAYRFIAWLNHAAFGDDQGRKDWMLWEEFFSSNQHKTSVKGLDNEFVLRIMAKYRENVVARSDDKYKKIAKELLKNRLSKWDMTVHSKMHFMYHDAEDFSRHTVAWPMDAISLELSFREFRDFIYEIKKDMTDEQKRGLYNAVVEENKESPYMPGMCEIDELD